MKPAVERRWEPGATRLIVLDAADGSLRPGAVADLATVLRAGDLLVVNDAATLPASLAGTTSRGQPIELRLCDITADGTAHGVLFGAGDWHSRTEDRAPPPPVEVGDLLLCDGLTAAVTGVDTASARLVALRFDAAGIDLWRGLYAAGRPVQYSYLAHPLALWDVQTAFAARPWAVEAPSAAFGLAFEPLLALRRSGVQFASITHAAGLSSTGDAALDARLPFGERYEVPPATVAAIAVARARGGRVIAVGTTVVRALESAARRGAGAPIAGAAVTDLRLSAATPLLVVDGIVTGMHEPGTSHFALLEAFAPRARLDALNARARALGFTAHEFGDVALVLAAPRRQERHSA